MWPWIKRWRDWAMLELWPIHRIGPQPQALHYRYEKAGLILDNQPIPWNADAVLVEALLRLSQPSSRPKKDFVLRLAGGKEFQPEFLRADTREDQSRLFFRLPVPSQSTTAELLWRGKSMGQLTLPVISREDFCRGLSLQMPTLQVRLGEQTVACLTFVSTQCGGLVASALLTGPTCLAPIQDLGLRVELCPERGGQVTEKAIRLTSSQLRNRQALVTAMLPKPRRLGIWRVSWMLGERRLAALRIKSISQQQFFRSLRISQTRFVLQSHKGEVSLAGVLPELKGLARIGPCFLVSSNEEGMAGLCTLQVRAQVPGALQPPLLLEQETLIGDGPSPFAPGTLNVDDLAQVTGFELRLKEKVLGLLPLDPAPAAGFSSEGGFTPPPDFIWTPAADDQLKDRLGRLLDEEDGI